MKLVFPILVASPILANGYQVGGGDFFFNNNGRPFVVSNMRGGGGRCGPFTSRSKFNACNNNYRNVDRAFEELAKEIKNDQQRRRESYRRRPGNDNAWNEQALREKQEWVNRAFDFAEDIASELGTDPRETNQALRQQQEFVNKLFGVASDFAAGRPTVKSQVLLDDAQVFQVALEVPGVKPADMDVSVDLDDDGNPAMLVVHLQRRAAKDEDGKPRTQELSKRFRLDSTAMVDKITASTENDGILTITVPKDMEKIQAMTQNIPVVVAPDDADTDEVNKEEVSSISLDLPGVKPANIQVTLKKNEENELGRRQSVKLYVRAERILSSASDNDATPRTQVLERSYNVDPKTTNIENIQATISNGVLTVSAPRKDKKKVAVKQSEKSDEDNEAEDESRKSISVEVTSALEKEEENNSPTEDDSNKEDADTSASADDSKE